MDNLKNELVIELDGEKLTLAGTFTNVFEIEKALGGIPNMAYKMTRGVLKDANGNTAEKWFPSLTDLAVIIFHGHEPKKYTLDQVWAKVVKDGMGLTGKITPFLMTMTAGTKAAATAEVEEVKKV